MLRAISCVIGTVILGYCILHEALTAWMISRPVYQTGEAALSGYMSHGLSVLKSETVLPFYPSLAVLLFALLLVPIRIFLLFRYALQLFSGMSLLYWSALAEIGLFSLALAAYLTPSDGSHFFSTEIMDSFYQTALLPLIPACVGAVQVKFSKHDPGRSDHCVPRS